MPEVPPPEPRQAKSTIKHQARESQPWNQQHSGRDNTLISGYGVLTAPPNSNHSMSVIAPPFSCPKNVPRHCQMSPARQNTPHQLRTPVLCCTALGPHSGPAHSRGPKTDGSIHPGPPTQNASARGRLPTVSPSRCIISAADIGSPNSQHSPLSRLSGGLPPVSGPCACVGRPLTTVKETAG